MVYTLVFSLDGMVSQVCKDLVNIWTGQWLTDKLLTPTHRSWDEMILHQKTWKMSSCWICLVMDTCTFVFTALNEHGSLGHPSAHPPIRHYCRLWEALNCNSKLGILLMKQNLKLIINIFWYEFCPREEKIYEDLPDTWSQSSNCRQGFKDNLGDKIWFALPFLKIVTQPWLCILTYLRACKLYHNWNKPFDIQGVTRKGVSR